MKILKYTFFGLALSTLVFACDDEDFTGDTSLTPSNPTVSVDLSDYPGSISFVEEDSTFTFPVTLSEPQVVDVSIYISQVEGTATLGVDYTIDNSNGRVFIPAGKTSGVASITVLADTEPEDDETIVLQIGDERTNGASLTPVTVSFTIANSFSTDFTLNMSWETPAIFGVDGTELAPTAVADLILNVYLDGALVGQADGAGFESISFGSSDDDGVYTVTASVYGVVDLGDLVSSYPTASVFLDYAQDGVGSGSLSFPAVLDLNNPCPANEYRLATVTKVGDEYSVEDDAGTLWVQEALVGDWIGYDAKIDGLNPDYYGESMIVASITAGGQFQLDGINVDFMENIWGETVETSVPVNVEVDMATFTFEIPEQYIFTTLYEGANYDYNIVGSGTINICSNEIRIQYEMLQDGFAVGAWLRANGFSSDAIFNAVVDIP